MAKSVARDLAFVKSKVISRLLESDEFAKVMLRKEDFTDDEKNDMEYMIILMLMERRKKLCLLFV